MICQDRQGLQSSQLVTSATAAAQLLRTCLLRLRALHRAGAPQLLCCLAGDRPVVLPALHAQDEPVHQRHACGTPLQTTLLLVSRSILWFGRDFKDVLFLSGRVARLSAGDSRLVVAEHTIGHL